MSYIEHICIYIKRTILKIIYLEHTWTVYLNNKLDET